MKSQELLRNSNVSTRLPAQNLERARVFYAEKLGLEPIEERTGGLRYQCGHGYFSLFESTGVPSGEHTQMAWEVDDIDAVVADLRQRGVIFEDVDVPGLKTVEGIAEVDGNQAASRVLLSRAVHLVVPSFYYRNGVGDRLLCCEQCERATRAS